MRSLIVAFVLLWLGATGNLFSQNFTCGSASGGSQQQVPAGEPFPSYGGIWLPSTGTIKAYVVFVQFKDHTVSDPNWPLNSLPNWASTFIASSFDQNGNYPAGSISKRMFGFSNGALHVVGDYYPQIVITNLNSNQYSSYGSVNLEVIQRIDANVNFASYDNWNRRGDYDIISGADNRVDLIIMLYRGVPSTAPSFYWGIAELGFQSYTTNDNGKVIYGYAPSSGLTEAYQPGQGTGPVMPFDDAVGLAVHETGHFFFGFGHFIRNFATLGAMSDGNGGSSFNSIERRWLGWMNFIYADSDESTVTLRDFFTTRDACALRIGSTNQWFIIENRQKTDPLDKAKYPGVYVYYFDGYYSYGLDIGTADGRWNWVWNSSTQQADKSSANPSTGTSKLQRVYLAGAWRYPPGYDGDSFDPFNFGYKTVLQPNINPPSYTRNGALTNVAMQLVSASNGVFTIKVYKNAVSGAVSGTVSQNATWAGSVSVVGTVTVNSGVTLTVLPGTAVSFASGTSLTINGTLNAQGTSSSPIYFTSATAATPGSWYGVSVQGSTSIFKWCTFQYGTIALNLSNNSGNQIQVENCTFRYNSYCGLSIGAYGRAKVKSCDVYGNTGAGMGILCNTYGGNIDLIGNWIHNNTGRGINSYYSNVVQLFGNVIEYNGAEGIFTAFSDIIRIGIVYGWWGYNTVRENGGDEVYNSQYYSTVELSGASVHDDAGWEIYNYPGNPTINAQSVYWNTDGPQTSGSVNLMPSVYWSLPDWDGQRRTAGSPIGKISAPLLTDEKEWILDPNISDAEKVRRCKQIIAKDPKSDEANTALIWLYAILRSDYEQNMLAEKERFFGYLQDIHNSSVGSPTEKSALQYMVIWKMMEKDFATVIQLSNEALKQTTGRERKWLLAAVVPAYAYSGQTEAAKNTLKELKQNYSDSNDIVSLLEFQIANIERQMGNGGWKPFEKTTLSENKIASNFEVSQNYPNPFNPSTVISYQLPAAGRVSLKVYNMLGQEVATLVDGIQGAGIKSVTFNASHLASGVYFYRLEALGKVLVNKLLLLK